MMRPLQPQQRHGLTKREHVAVDLAWCPQCDAPPGELCLVYSRGPRVLHPHVERVAACFGVAS
jgi:hypothetical protein